MDSSDNPVLVTGVPGRVGGVGSSIVEILRRRGLPVRALVLREDERTDALRANGIDVVVGDLTEARDVAGALSGCRRMYFGMSGLADEPYRDDGLSPAAAALALRAGAELVRIARRPCPAHGLPPTPLFSRIGRRNRLPGTPRFGCRLVPHAPRRSTRGMWLKSLQPSW